MLRVLPIFLLLLSFLNAQFLEPKEAFQTSFQKSEEGLRASIVLDETIYLYADQIKIFVVNDGQRNEITQELDLPQWVEYDDFYIYSHRFDIEIPASYYDGAQSVSISYQGCSKAGLCYPPNTMNYQLQEVETVAALLSETGSIAQKMQDSNILFVLLTFFGFGVLLSLTPCVFPMVPILSSIIVSHTKDGEIMNPKKGFILSAVYVLSMSVAYAIAGMIAGVFGANLQAALQNPFVLVVFAAIFVALALSMFGYYKLELPQSVQNLVNKKTDGVQKKGVKGVAIMGFLSALIVGPCVTPPLAGALVYIGQTGNALLGGAALFVMSIGMGLPLLALGVGAGKFMPKPGGWMEIVSKVFGVVMLGIAIWMLERVLPSVITMLLWAALFLGSAWYLKAYKMKKPKIKKIIGVVLALYGAALIAGAFSGASSPLDPLEKFYGEPKEALEFYEVKTVDELESILAQTNRVVMIDFTASWCVSCRDLKNITFMDARVQELMKEFVLLKVDVSANNAYDRALMQKYNVVGPPVLVFYQDGRELPNHIVGFVNAEQFLNYIDQNLR